MALELSSFQLHDCPHVKPQVGVLLNLSSNHLDRYHSLEEYYGDKALLFRNADAASVSVSNADDAAVQGIMASGARAAPAVLAGAAAPTAGSIARAAGSCSARTGCSHAGGCRSWATTTSPTRSRRRSWFARRAASLAAMAAGLTTFRAIEHRVEPVREVDGVLWINDSKSTNVTSTEVAIAALDRPFVLLLGGRHKGEPYTRLGAAARAALPGGGGVRRVGRPGGARPARGACRWCAPARSRR